MTDTCTHSGIHRQEYCNSYLDWKKTLLRRYHFFGLIDPQNCIKANTIVLERAWEATCHPIIYTLFRSREGIYSIHFCFSCNKSIRSCNFHFDSWPCWTWWSCWPAWCGWSSPPHRNWIDSDPGSSSRSVLCMSEFFSEKGTDLFTKFLKFKISCFLDIIAKKWHAMYLHVDLGIIWTYHFLTFLASLSL